MLGRALAEVLPDAVYVGREDGDLRDPAAVERIFSTHRPERVVHLAARVGGVKENAEHNLEMFEENVLMTTLVVQASVRHGARRFLMPLSSCAFPLFDDRATTEVDLFTGMPFDGNLGYGFAKRAAAVQVRLAAERLGAAYQTFTPVTMFGPHDDFDPERGHVVAALISRSLAAERAKRPLTIWGSGRAVRQFVYVRDVARAVAALIERSDTGNVIVAPDAGVTVRQLAEAVAEAAGFTGELRFDPAQPEGVARKVLVNQGCPLPKLEFTPLAVALRETVAWYREHEKETS